VHDEFMKNPPKDRNDLEKRNSKSINFSPDMQKIDDSINEYIKENIHDNEKVTTLDHRGKRIVCCLYDAYKENIKLLPKDWRKKIGILGPKEIIIANYISGMTDRFALQQYERIYGTRIDR